MRIVILKDADAYRKCSRVALEQAHLAGYWHEFSGYFKVCKDRQHGLVGVMLDSKELTNRIALGDIK